MCHCSLNAKNKCSYVQAQGVARLLLLAEPLQSKLGLLALGSDLAGPGLGGSLALEEAAARFVPCPSEGWVGGSSNSSFGATEPVKGTPMACWAK